MKREMSINFPALIILILSMTGCASVHYMKMSSIKTEGQEFVYDDGKETIISKKTHFVTLAPYSHLNNATSFTSYVLYVQNLGKEFINISSDNIRVSLKVKSAGQPASNTQPINVLSFSDVMMEIEEEEGRRKRAAAWAAAAGALSASSAAYSTSTTYNTGRTYGSYSGYGSYGYRPYTAGISGNYSGSYSGISTTTTYDPAKARILANQNSQNFRNNLDSIAASAQNSRQLAEQLVMKAQTIAPGEGHGGLVVTDTRELTHKIEGEFEIEVTVGEERHVFFVRRSFYQNKK
ncbi:MAG: hypothetical protein KIT59_01590 [Nitrosomonas sp.]|nr:hypothetical protein [Nitrosomonas sp.]